MSAPQKEWNPSNNEYWKKHPTDRSAKNDNKEWKSFGFDMNDEGPKSSDYWLQGVETDKHHTSFHIPALARLAQRDSTIFHQAKGVTRVDVDDFHGFDGEKLKYGMIHWQSNENIRCPKDWTVFDPINGKCVCIYDARNKLVLKFEPNANEQLGGKILTFYP